MNIFFFVRNYYSLNDLFIQKFAKKVDIKNKKILDIGAGNMKLKKLIKKAQYFAMEIEQNKNNTIHHVADINEPLLLKDNSIDSILCIQVLEHVKNPHKLFREFQRILKKKGHIALSTNFVYETHMEPNDYFRFTKYGLRQLAIDNGFRILSIREQGGFFQVIFYLVTNAPFLLFFKKNTWTYYLYWLIFFIPFSALGIITYLLDYLDINKKITINYECEFVKI